MSISFDAHTQGSAGAASLTFAHTIGSTANILFVGLYIDGNKTLNSAPTWNGVSMTLLTSARVDASHSFEAVYYLASPTTGTHNVFIDASATTTIIGDAVSFISARITGIPDASNTTTASGSAANIATSVTVVAPNCWTLAFGNVDGNSTAPGTVTAQAGLTLLSSTSVFPVGYSNGTVSTGANNLGFNFQNATTFRSIIGLSFAPDNTPARYWVGGTGSWDATTTTHWSLTSGGSGGALAPDSTTQGVFFNGSSGGGTVTLTANLSLIDVTFTGFTGTFAGSNTLNLSGNLTLATGMTLTYTGGITFSATATGKTLTTSGKTILSALTFNGSGGGWTLQDDVTTSSTITLTTGTLALSSRTIMMSGTGTLWTATGGTVSAGTSTIKYTNASSSTKTFAGGGQTYNNIWITGSGTGAYTITGSNTFKDIKVDTPPHTVNFTAGTAQRFQTFTVNGSAGNLMTLQSTVSGTSWYLYKTTSGNVVCDYLSLQDSHISSLL